MSDLKRSAKMKTKFITTSRIIAASICGICQFMLVIGGVIYWTKFAQDNFPDAEFIKSAGRYLGGILALLSLLWPIYVFSVAQRSFK
jgi:hypothetical protein